MLENIKRGEFSHPRLKICTDLPGINPLLSLIKTDRNGGEALRQNIFATAEIMGRRWQSENCPERNGMIIGIPRSGIPMSDGLRAVFSKYNYCSSNDGANKDVDQPVLPDDLNFDSVANLLIADSVIVTGATVTQTLKAALSKARSIDRIAVFSVFASADGIMNLFDVFPGLEINIGSFAKTKQHWDIHRWKLSTTLEGIPNIGQLVSR
jgi:hypothetical protein